jgi:hypothetical protein
VTPLIAVGRLVRRARDARFMPASLYRCVARIIILALVRLRIRDSGSLPKRGTIAYDQFMESYFVVMVTVSGLNYLVLVPRFRIGPGGGFVLDVICIVMLMVLGMRVVEMLLYKFGLALGGIPKREGDRERRERLFVISVFHVLELVLFFSALKMIVIKIVMGTGGRLESLYAVQSGVCLNRWLLFLGTIQNMTSVKPAQFRPVNWLTQGIGLAEGVLGVFLILVFFGILFAKDGER